MLRHSFLLAAFQKGAVVLALLLGIVLSGASRRAEAAAINTEPVPALPPGWTLEFWSGAQPGVSLAVLKRAPIDPPARYRLVVLPGSGCTGWLPVATRYFSGLLHAELLVLHKPGVNVNAGLGADCPPNFIQQDTLSSWRDHAQAALQMYFSASPNPAATPMLAAPTLPTLLMGISEGAELLPDLADHVPALAGVVMISAPGLDPRDAGELQAQRLGHGPAWRALEQAQASDADDHDWYEGRTLRYWRDFWHWQLAQPLLEASWPLLRVWGDADALVPLIAYERFAQRAQHRAVPLCDLRLPGADHGLQSGPVVPRDGLQWLWARIEMWGRKPAGELCELVRP